MRVFLIFILCALSWSAFAHGGEDHGDAAATPLPGEQGSVASASGSVFEVVLKSSPIQPGEASTVRVLVSDFETNMPVKGAVVDIEMKDSSKKLLTTKAVETKTSGVYEFKASFPSEGSYSFDLTVQAEQRADLLAISGFVVKALSVVTASTSSTLPLLLGGGVALFLIAFFLGFFFGRTKPAKEEVAT